MPVTVLPLKDIDLGYGDIDNDLVTKLVEEFQEDGGFKFPPLLVENAGPTITFSVVDGKHRILAQRKLGANKITAVVAFTYQEAMEILAEAHQDHQPSPERIWNIYSTLRPLGREYYRFLRQNSKGVPRSTKIPKTPEEMKATPYLARSLGVGNNFADNSIAFFRRVFDSTGKEQELAQRVAPLVRNGSMSVYQGNAYVKNNMTSTSTIEDPARQRELIETAMATMNGALRGIGMLGPIGDEISKDEIDTWWANASRLRVKVHRFVKLLEECRNVR